MYKAIFFDFDGVILESSEIKTDAFVALFDHYPEHLEEIREYHMAHMGISRYEKFEWYYKNLFHKPLSVSEKGALGERFTALVYEKIMAAAFVPGALALLQHMQGVGLSFVASGTPEPELQEIVKQRELMPYFKEVCGSPRTKKEIVNDIIARYDLNRATCLFIGDASSDWEAARETGVPFVARNTPEMAPFWLAEGVYTVENLKEIITS